MWKKATHAANTRSLAIALKVLLAGALFAVPCQSQRIIGGYGRIVDDALASRYLQDPEIDGNVTDIENTTDTTSFFDSNLIFIVTANILEEGPETQELFVSTFVDSYNEGNACDPENRIAINGTTLAIGFDLDVAGDSFAEFDRPVDSPHRDRELQTINITDQSGNETLSPTTSPSGVVDFGRSTTSMLVNVLGTCSDCDSDTALFTNDILDRKLRRAQICDGPNPGIILEIFQSNLELVLPEIGVLGWFELGSTNAVEDNLINLLDDVVPSAAPTVSMQPSISPTCINEVNFTTVDGTEVFDSNLLFIVSEDILLLGMDAQLLFVALFIDSYNEGNLFNEDTCDPFFRLAINGTLLAIGFELEVISEATPTFDFTNSSFSAPRRLQLTNSTVPESNITTTSPSESPTSFVNFTQSTTMLVNVIGTCNDCPSGTTLFSNDVVGRRLQTREIDSLCGIPCTGPDPEVVFDIFQSNLDESLPGVQVLEAVELGSTDTLGDNLTDILDNIVPSAAPSLAPAENSEDNPTDSPTSEFSEFPSEFPTEFPTEEPTSTTNSPTPSPSAKTPSAPPSLQPSSSPSLQLSQPPSNKPSQAPSSAPTATPSNGPTPSPSASPSEQPTTCTQQGENCNINNDDCCPGLNCLVDTCVS